MAFPTYVVSFGLPATLVVSKVLDQFDAGQNVGSLQVISFHDKIARKAMEGISIIYHLAAGIEKSFAGAFMNSALATRNLMDAFLEAGSSRNDL